MLGFATRNPTYHAQSLVFSRLEYKGYLLKYMPMEEVVNAIRCINRGYTQLAPGLLPQVMNCQQQSATKTEIINPALLVAVGATNQEIAKKLLISQSNVKTQINNIFNRLNIKNKSQLAIFANSFVGREMLA